MVKSILQDLYRLQALDIQGLPAQKSQAKNLRAGIPTGMLNNYDRARARGRKGVAILRDRVCTNCRMQSPIAVVVGLTAGTIQVCGNCGLYLCLDPDQSISPAPEVIETAKRRGARKATGLRASS